MKVSFHPKMDNVLAVGTYDGGIRIHKLEKETDSLIAASRIEQYSHRDPITALHWLKNQVDNSYVLASMSSDGLVLWWSAKNRLEKPIAMYKFTDLERGAPLGATALSFLNKFAGSSVKNKGAPTTDNSFIIGTEVGQIVKSSFSQVERINTTKQDFFKQKVEVINSTLDFTYDSATGYTHCVESSPFRRDVFLTASSDGLVRLYNSFKQKDMVTLQPERGSSINTGFAYDARWSPFRPLVVGIGTDTGKLLLYDLSESIANPVVAIDNHTEKEVKASTTMTSSLHGRSIYCVRFNQASRELLATGGQTGVVKVWLLNDELTQTQKKEQEKLAQLFQ
jgi:WD40 repeat protein